MPQKDMETAAELIVSLAYLLLFALCIAARWKLYKKMGRKGWEAVVPYYSTYVLFDELYGNGWKMLLLLIPFYRIVLYVRSRIDWARSFGKKTGFGVGLALLEPIFSCILAFGDACYRPPFFARNKARVPEPTVVYVDRKRSREAAQELRDLAWMKAQGEIGEDMYEEVKHKLLRQI